MRCRGRVAIVTGATGGGIGRSIALTLAREGAFVVVNYRKSDESSGAIVEHVHARGGRAIAVQANVYQANGCSRLVDAAISEFGRIDICIVGPGAGWHPEPIDRLNSSAALEDIRREMAPLYHFMPLVLPGMYERHWGRVIAIGLSPPCDSPAYAYNVAKAARAKAILMAQDQAWQHGVTLNIVGCGPVNRYDSLSEALEHTEHGPAWYRRATASPQDIAEGVTFLCSEAGRFISGCELPFNYRLTS